jgi:hypothetical protein
MIHLKKRRYIKILFIVLFAFIVEYTVSNYLDSPEKENKIKSVHGFNMDIPEGWFYVSADSENLIDRLNERLSNEALHLIKKTYNQKVDRILYVGGDFNAEMLIHAKFNNVEPIPINKNTIEGTCLTLKEMLRQINNNNEPTIYECKLMDKVKISRDEYYSRFIYPGDEANPLRISYAFYHNGSLIHINADCYGDSNQCQFVESSLFNLLDSMTNRN